MVQPLIRFAGAVTALCVLVACAATRPRGGEDEWQATLAVLATSDLHGNVLGFDYYRRREDPTVGFDRVATLVAQARARYADTLLVDNGDTIQGTPLADWQARVQPPACEDRLAIHVAMDHVGYDAGTLGNHEFNYGLPFLSQVAGVPFDDGQADCRGPGFPLLLSNLVHADDGRPLLPPRLLLERQLHARDAKGEVVRKPVRIGLVALAPPGIMKWDARHLAGRVRMVDALDATRGQVAALRADGADVVIALVHGGLDARPWDGTLDNPGWHVAASGLVDAMVLGHEHLRFPDPHSARPAYGDLPGVDAGAGRVHGVPAVMPSFWGRALGVIELSLRFRDGRWQVDRDDSRSLLLPHGATDASGVTPDAQVAGLVAQAHAGTLAWLEEPIAETRIAMTTFFADVGDTSALDVVNRAQVDYLRERIDADWPQLRGLPLLSAAAPFKTGSAGPDDYTQVAAGPLAIRHAADLYLYPNTLVAVKVTGAQLKAWLEQSAKRFNRIDPDVATPQPLVDTGVAGYNFDVIDGVRYVIDLTRETGARIVDLRHADGRAVDPQEWLLVATNNYRAGNGQSFGFDASALVVDTQAGNRDVLIDWLRERRVVDGRDPRSAPPWRFAPLPPQANVTFSTRAGLAAEPSFGPHRLQRVADTDDGRAVYRLHVGPE